MGNEIFQERKTLFEAVQYCGTYALKEQEQVTRTYKSDGTVLTKTDLFINSFLTDTIKRLYPSCGIISEESEEIPSFDKQWYFVLDPIDGSDTYSQGMPSWCIAVGILDNQFLPVGGIVYAPRWGIGSNRGLLVSRFPDETAYIGDEPLQEKEFTLPVRQIAVSSNSHNRLKLAHFDGKFRTFGSTILHILAPLIHSHVDMAVFTPCYLWDIAAGDGIVSPFGLELRYPDGSAPDYQALCRREKTRDIIFVGTSGILDDVILKLT